MRWPYVVAPVVVFVLLVLTALIAGPGRSGAEWASVLETTVHATCLAFVTAALVAVCFVLRGGEGARPAALAGALALLAIALIWGKGDWATPLALAACGIAPLLLPRGAAAPPPPPPA